ncbi:MAG: response regulator [Thermodesulfovibrionales bacterium]|jgi:CheY-like chemotaxis protein
MSIITVFTGKYCNEELAIKEILEKTGYKYLTDSDIAAKAGRLSDLPESKILKAFSAKVSVFNQFTHEKERSIAYLKLAVAETLTEDNLLINGFTSLLIPAGIAHVLKVCLISDMKYRLSIAGSSGMSENEALKMLHRSDEDRMSWTKTILEKDDPWDISIYDMVLPTDKTNSKEIADLVKKTLEKDILKTSAAGEKAIHDFILAARVETELIKAGHFIIAESNDGAVTLTINKNVLMLKRLEEELQSLSIKIPGVQSVATKVGRKFYQPDIVRRYDLEMPSKLLLVDDERQFAQTLSDRLHLREIGSVIAYDGESALDIIREDEPDVMILDLKMPGIDGIEVLKRVKQTNPKIEVIILTGQGSEADREQCMNLGAFAYLEKPVDVNVLSDTIKKANEKIKQSRKI